MPIKMRFECQRNAITLPTNPDHIKINRASPAIKTEVATLGEIGIPTTPTLASINIRSLFEYEELQAIDEELRKKDERLIMHIHQYQHPNRYVNWFRNWQLSKQPARFTVIGLKHFDMWVICESFDYDVKAGEEHDIYYELSLSEFRPYGAKPLPPPIGADNPNQILKPAPPRINNKLPVPANYTVQSGDNIVSICLKLAGTDTRWKELYNANIDIIGANPKLTPGTVLVIPESWRSLKSLHYSE